MSPAGIELETMAHRRFAVLLLLGIPILLGAGPGDGATFVGFITDTECGANHAPMIAKGGMGKDDRECTYACVAKGATFGFVDIESRRFFQLDDQAAPRPFAGQKVQVTGRIGGDTIFVERIVKAD
jgi:hypothetical protein